MRNVKWIALALLLAASVSPPAEAASPSLGLEITAAPDIVEVAVRCGRHAHYIRGHRTRSGHWVRGRCVRYRPHR
jgi:hypothetical protein